MPARSAASGASPESITASTMRGALYFGDVWAFSDNQSRAMVYQNVRTGRVLRELLRPVACGSDCRALHVGTGVALLPREGRAGDIAILGARGEVARELHVPICK